MGEPSKFDFAKQDEYLKMRRLGVGKRRAAQSVGMTREGVRQHAKNHEDFALLDKQAPDHANEAIESALFQSALKGNVTAQQVWLYNRDPARWKDMRAQRFVPDDATLASLEAIPTGDLRKILDAHTAVRDAHENGHADGNGSANGGSSKVH